ncbi:unnamed protein product [Moneuplotes crassus]|uniref:Uncharacterized protein n=2 Tax=Euplotes crassus TaxID=5936 RepID=A0AAD1U5R7_EUPCR|nr:unnamed protein product [Moneuplotes crassus]
MFDSIFDPEKSAEKMMNNIVTPRRNSYICSSTSKLKQKNKYPLPLENVKTAFREDLKKGFYQDSPIMVRPEYLCTLRESIKTMESEGKPLNIKLNQTPKIKKRPQTAKAMRKSMKPSVRKVKLSVEQRNIINAAKKNIFSYFKRVCSKKRFKSNEGIVQKQPTLSVSQIHNLKMNSKLPGSEKIKKALESNSKPTRKSFGGAQEEPKAKTFSVKDELGNTALYYAVDGGFFESVDLILKTGVNINIRNEDGNTCLHKAMIRDNERMINYLVARGANIHALNNYKQTPLFYASNYILKKYGYLQQLAVIDREKRPEKRKTPKIMKQYLKELKTKLGDKKSGKGTRTLRIRLTKSLAQSKNPKSLKRAKKKSRQMSTIDIRQANNQSKLHIRKPKKKKLKGFKMTQGGQIGPINIKL